METNLHASAACAVNLNLHLHRARRRRVSCEKQRRIPAGGGERGAPFARDRIAVVAGNVYFVSRFAGTNGVCRWEYVLL